MAFWARLKRKALLEYFRFSTCHFDFFSEVSVKQYKQTKRVNEANNSTTVSLDLEFGSLSITLRPWYLSMNLNDNTNNSASVSYF